MTWASVLGGGHSRQVLLTPPVTEPWLCVQDGNSALRCLAELAEPPRVPRGDLDLSSFGRHWMSPRWPGPSPGRPVLIGETRRLVLGPSPSALSAQPGLQLSSAVTQASVLSEEDIYCLLKNVVLETRESPAHAPTLRQTAKPHGSLSRFDAHCCSG